MNKLPVAGLVGLAALGAEAQTPALKTFVSSDPVVVTATRELGPYTPTMRDTVVITREELEESGALSLAEVLQRRASIEIRTLGGPGQPASLFLRGASPAQTLVLVDGLRVASATTGTAAIQSIPLDMIERIEIVKGPMSSLYGSDAMGGVIQIFTRGKTVPHLFGSASYGTDNDRRAAAGLATVDGAASASISLGARKVDAPSASNPRSGSFVFVPDRDPHENAFANARFAYRMWQGETVELEGFGSKARTRYDNGVPDVDDRSEQTISGVKLSSSNHFTQDWSSRLSFAHTRDKLVFHGSFEGFFETRQDQASWINELRTEAGSLVGGYEEVRQRVGPGTQADAFTGEDFIAFSRTRRRIRSVFASINEGWQGNRLEANARRDDIELLGVHNTGSVSYGYEWSPALRVSATVGRGFRAPTFNDLFSPAQFGGNANLKPERNSSREIAVGGRSAPLEWRITAFDNRFRDLILFNADANQVINVAGARVRGVEATAATKWLGVQWRGMLTLQRPRNDDTGARLPSRAERLASLDASRAFGSAWNAGLTVVATGERFDSLAESPSSRLPGHALLDARVRYRINKYVVAELTGTNLANKRYESAVGYDAPRRAMLLNVRFDAF
ncbi:MAG: TonB-dependent receptor domain-containing protein [Betaproteobacteria bacterium]